MSKENANCQLSVRQMARILKKLTLHEDDVILIRKSKFSEQEILEQIKRGVENLKLKRVLAILVDDYEDISALNHQEMNKHGWYHLDQINKITNRMR